MMKYWKHALVILSVLGMLGGGIMKVDSIYAKAEKVVQMKESIVGLNARLDQFIKKDRMNNVQERVWVIEDRYVDKPMPDTVKEEYRKLIKEVSELEKDTK